MASSIAKDIKKYLVPAKKLVYGEFCYYIKLSHKLKDDAVYKQFYALISALLNTSGGIIEIDLGVPTNGKQFDVWRNNLADQLLKFMTKPIYSSCISLHVVQHDTFMLIHKSPEFITLKTHMFTRGCMAETREVQHYQEIIACHKSTLGTVELIHKGGPYLYGDVCPYTESKHREFKHFDCSTVDDLIGRLKGTRPLRSLTALANTDGGGEIIIGIKEQYTHNMYLGQDVDKEEETYFVHELNEILKVNVLTGTRRIWGDPHTVPMRNRHWAIMFVPLGSPPYVCSPRCRSCPHRKRKVLICLRIFHCPGGVYEQIPESFVIKDDGSIGAVPFADWQSNHRVKPRHLMKFEAMDWLRSICQGDTVSVSHNAARPISEIPETLKDGMTLSFKAHSSRFQLNKKDPEIRHKYTPSCGIFQMTFPVHHTPDRKILESYSPDINAVLETIDREMDRQKSFGIGDHTLYSCLNLHTRSLSGKQRETRKPKNHIMDFLVINERTQITLFIVGSTMKTGAERSQLESYGLILTRTVKKKLFEQMDGTGNYRAINVQCKVISLDGRRYETSYLYQAWLPRPDPEQNLSAICSAVAHMLSAVPCFYRDEIHRGADLMLSQEQIEVLLSIDQSRFTIIDGPPGCGKTRLALKTCEMFGEDKSVYLSASLPLNRRVAAMGPFNVDQVKNGADILRVLKCLSKQVKYVIIDDNHSINYTEESMHNICKHIAESVGMHMYCFQDSVFQNYRDLRTSLSLQQFIIQRMQQYGSFDFKTLKEIRRNSQVVGSFLKAQISDLAGSVPEVECVSSVQGDDVLIRHIKHLRQNDNCNGLIGYVRDLLKSPAPACDSMTEQYVAQDIAILTDETEVAYFRQLLETHFRTLHVHGAEEFPIKGIIVDHLGNFVGLESKVVVVVLPTTQKTGKDMERPVLNNKYRIAVASRAIQRVDFLQEEPLDKHIVAAMHCDHLPSDSIEAASGGLHVKTKSGGNPQQDIRVRDNRCIGITADGDVLCCIRGRGVQQYSLVDGSYTTYGSPVTDRKSCQLTVNKAGDIAVVWSTRGSTFLHIVKGHTCQVARPHDLGKGNDPIVAWRPSGGLAVCTRQDSRWYIVMYNIDRRRQTRRWELNCDEVGDVAVDSSSKVFCCDTLNDRISVYKENGDNVLTWSVDDRKRDFRYPVSLCTDDNDRLLVLHKGRVDGKDMGLVSMWKWTGEYLRDVVTDLPKPHRSSSIRLQDNTTVVISIDSRIKSFHISDILQCAED